MTFELRPDLYESISYIKIFGNVSYVALRGKIFSWERVFLSKILMWGTNLVG